MRRLTALPTVAVLNVKNPFIPICMLGGRGRREGSIYLSGEQEEKRGSNKAAEEERRGIFRFLPSIATLMMILFPGVHARFLSLSLSLILFLFDLHIHTHTLVLIVLMTLFIITRDRSDVASELDYVLYEVEAASEHNSTWERNLKFDLHT